MAGKIRPRGKKGILYFTYMYQGKPKWHNCRTTDRLEAKRQKAEMEGKLLDRKAGRIQEHGLWSDFVTEYLNYSKANKRERSYNRDVFTINTFNNLCPIKYFKDYTFSKLEEYKSLRKEQVSIVSINRELNTLKNMGRMAISLHYSHENPVRDVRIYKLSNAGRDRFLTKDEALKLMNGIEAQHLRAACMLGLKAATRIGEAMHILWENVDFGRNVIYLVPIDGWRPKTDSDARQEIPLNNELKAFLLNLRRYGKYVCSCEDGTTLSDEVASVMIGRRMKQLGILNATSHTLRHTCLSWAAASMSWLSVVKLARHTNPKMTMRYAHLSPEFNTSEINKLPSVLK